MSISLSLRERCTLTNLLLGQKAPATFALYRTQNRSFDAFGLGEIEERFHAVRPGEEAYPLEKLDTELRTCEVTDEARDYVRGLIEEAAKTGMLSGIMGRVLWPVVEKLQGAELVK